MQRALTDFAAAARRFALQTAAALRIQAAVRGWLARQQASALRAAAAACRAEEEGRRQAARAVIGRWVPVFRERTRLLRLRCEAGFPRKALVKQGHGGAVAALVVQASRTVCSALCVVS